MELTASWTLVEGQHVETDKECFIHGAHQQEDSSIGVVQAEHNILAQINGLVTRLARYQRNMSVYPMASNVNGSHHLKKEQPIGI